MDPHLTHLLVKLTQAVDQYVADVAGRGAMADDTELQKAKAAVARLAQPQAA